MNRLPRDQSPISPDPLEVGEFETLSTTDLLDLLGDRFGAETDPAGSPSFESDCRWSRPDRPETNYAYPVVVVIRRSGEPEQAAEAWFDAIGRQNAIGLTIADPFDRTLSDTKNRQRLDAALAAAWLSRPDGVTVREDRVFAVGRREVGSQLVRSWLARSAWLSGVAAVEACPLDELTLRNGRQTGRLLVTTAAGWHPAARTLFAAGADVELRPSASDLVSIGRLINAWVLRAIPTAVGC